MAKWIGLTIVGLVVFVGIVFGLVAISIFNNEAKLRNQFNAQQKANEASFDKVWKTIQSQASVANEERESFRETYEAIMVAQRGVAGNGSLASFLNQSQISVSDDLFQTLMVTIEAQRESFLQNQEKLLDIKRQHDNMLDTFPSSLLLASRERLEPKLVLSEKTDSAFSSGQENDIELFRN